MNHNVNQNVIILIEFNPTFEKIYQKHDSVKLVNLLCKMCRKEVGVVYSSNTRIHPIGDLITCKQDNVTIIDYLQTIKLKSDVVTTQYGDTWLPSIYKDLMIRYHSNKKWNSETHDECTDTHQVLLNTYVRNRLVATIGAK